MCFVPLGISPVGVEFVANLGHFEQSWDVSDSTLNFTSLDAGLTLNFWLGIAIEISNEGSPLNSQTGIFNNRLGITLIPTQTSIYLQPASGP